MNYKISAVVEKDDNGNYAYCPELEGCQTQGDTFEEVMTNIKEAIDVYIETLDEDEIREVMSREILSTNFEVRVG